MLSPGSARPMTRSQTRGRGPITSLPTELLLAILNMLLNECADMLGRQQAAQRFLRVNRAFHSAYRLSPSAHESVLRSTAQAVSLTTRLNDASLDTLKLQRLPIRLSTPAPHHDTPRDAVVARLVAACAAELRRFVVRAEEEWSMDAWTIESGLPEAWQQCNQLEEFEFTGDERQVTAGQAQGMLAAWSKITGMRMINIWIDFKSRRERLPNRSPAGWTVPTRLRTLELFVWDMHTCNLLAALIKASAPTLQHLGLVYAYDDDHLDVHAALPAAVLPAADTLASFRLLKPDSGDGDLACVARLLGNLTHIQSIAIPLGVGILAPLATELGSRRPLEELTLYDREAGGDEHWPRVVEFLAAVQVHSLKLSVSWLFWVSMVEGLTENEEDVQEALGEEMSGAQAEVEGLGVSRFEWIQGERLEWR